MNSLNNILSVFGQILQQQLFPRLKEELGPLKARYVEFVSAVALLQMDGFVAVRHGRGRPAYDRTCIARAFLAKAVFHLPHTRALLDRLAHDVTLRRLCGWESAALVPHESVFSRAFAELARQEFGQRVHEALIERTQSERLAGHVIRDSTAIPAREKPKPKPKLETPKVRRRHRRSGTTKQSEQMTRIERQCSGSMTLAEMVNELPRDCNVGCKPNGHGHKEYWNGYKLHMDVIDGNIPISCVLTSASLNDNQVAIPLAMMSAQRVTSCYDLMDAGYDCEAIRQHSRTLGHMPIIRGQKHGAHQVLMDPHQMARYRERTAIERVFSRLKEEYGFATVRVRGACKVIAHLMFGVLALSADQILRWCAGEDSVAPAPS
jgi:hypothetical protein